MFPIRPYLQYLWLRGLHYRRIIDYIGNIEGSAHYKYIREEYSDEYLKMCSTFGANIEMNLRKGRTKATLRDIYNKFGVQDSSTDACKLYVATPQREWLKYKLKDDIVEYIDSSILTDEGIIDRKN